MHYSYPVLSTYKDSFKKLNTLYLIFAKKILGVDETTSGFATLVRLGWMPLDYMLAYRAAIWYMKMLWARTNFYKPAHDFIHRLDPSLLKISCIRVFRGRLLDVIFDESER